VSLALAVAMAGSIIAADPGPMPSTPYVLVLGVAQDGGVPQPGCTRPCCSARRDPADRRCVACVAIVEPATDTRWIVDATPDFREQLARLDAVAPPADGAAAPGLAGILLTHAHVGHYTGLIHVGHEVMGARGVPVWAMPRMWQFLSSNGPWDQLVRYGNIELRPLADGEPVALSAAVTITPLRVPHREEYSEAVGFRIDGPDRSVLYIPDIDKWDRWDRSIEALVASVDVALLDGTFFDGSELPGRDMAAIPHPFIVESLARFSMLPAEQRDRIHFIHLNHTNPALEPGGDAARTVEEAGLHVARELAVFEL